MLLLRFTNFSDVVRFHAKMGLPSSGEPKLLEPDLFEFRYEFMVEEDHEIMQAYTAADMVGFADGLVDLAYVVFGTAHHMCFDWSDVPSFNEMKRLDLRFRRGDLGKPPAFINDDRNNERLDANYKLILWFAEAHDEGDLPLAEQALAATIHNCYKLALNANLPWNELWDEVQGANMKKERATATTVDKRDWKFDVIKPAGWAPPDIAGVLKRAGWQP